MKNSILLSFIVWFALPCTAQEMYPPYIIHTVRTQAFADQKEVVLRVEMKKISAESCTNWAWGAWGNAGECPHLRVVDFSLKIGDREIDVPRSAYADLGGTLALKLTQKKSLLHVDIHAGDADTSYYATLVFSEKFIQKRIVYSGEFSESFREETFYNYKETVEPAAQ